MKTTKIMNIAYDEVAQFNEIAGNLSNVTLDSISNQLSFIFEELTETIDALEAGDLVGMLDGGADLFVTVSGLLQKLEAFGFNVPHALGRVNANNLTKFPKVGDLFGNKNGYTVTLNEKYQRVVLKDANGKVRKPDEFVAVDLADLIPE